MSDDGIRMSAYEEVAEAIRQAIAAGEYGIGDRLPPIHELSDQHRVSHMTIKRAIDVLRTEGLIVSKPGVRTQVVATPGAQPPPLQDQIDALRETVDDLAQRLAAVESHSSQSNGRTGTKGERESA